MSLTFSERPADGDAAGLLVLHHQTGIEPARTVLGGFSMGSVMSYAVGLSGDRPAPAGILAFAGFIPTVEGWATDLPARSDMPVFIADGRSSHAD